MAGTTVLSAWWRRGALGLASITVAFVLGFVPVATASTRAHSCGVIEYGKGWFLYANRNVSCRTARQVFHGYFRKFACYSKLGNCTVPPYYCHSWLNPRTDVGHVRCTASGNRIVRFQSGQ
jgi:hypothetical protein